MTKTQANEPGFVLVPVEFLDFIKHAPVSSGVCCCGDEIDKHSDPMSCGHSPVDMWDHGLEGWLNQIAAAPIVPAPAYGGVREPERCPECRGTTFAQVDDRWPGGGFRPGTNFRCVECKLVTPGLSSAPVEEADAKAGERGLVQLPDGWLAIEMKAAEAEIAKWSAGLRASFESLFRTTPAASTIPSEPESKGEAGAGPVRCSSCDGTGDLIRVDGEWIGWCPCGAAANAGAGPVGEAQDARRAALIERLGTIADLTTTTPLEGELGDVAYDLLREAAAQIASDRQRLATRPVDEPGEVERLTRELAEAEDEIDRLTDENSDLRGDPWPTWATAVLEVIRERSGYDGYDDTSEGVDLPAELNECMGELESAEKHQRARAETAEAVLAYTRERLEKVEAALRYYAWENEPRLPSEGPWGINSTDFGKIARAALSTQESSAALAGDGKEVVR